jgi:tetratricopeptide (TPR) repeat protein
VPELTVGQPPSAASQCGAAGARSGWSGFWLMLAAVIAGCSLLPEEPAAPSPPPASPRGPSPAAVALLAKGRSLFDKGQYELAAAAFEGAASDPKAAVEAQAFLARIKVLLGSAPADSWRVDPARVAEPAMAARLAVEVRLLLNEARRLLAENRTDEAILRLKRAQGLIDACPLPGHR